MCPRLLPGPPTPRPHAALQVMLIQAPALVLRHRSSGVISGGETAKPPRTLAGKRKASHANLAGSGAFREGLDGEPSQAGGPDANGSSDGAGGKVRRG